MYILKNMSFKILSFLFVLFLFLTIFPTVFAADNNKVIFDETGPYGKYYTIYNVGPYGASSFANLLQNNGFEVSQINQPPLTYDKIKNCNVLILMAPARDYTDDEINSIKKYVNEGGGLFLLGDGWGLEDGTDNYGFNKIARGFGVEFSYNTLLADPNHNLGYVNFLKISNISSQNLSSNIDQFYFMQGPYLKNTGSSNVLAYSDNDSWGDSLFLVPEGYSVGNQKKDSNETSGPFPVSSAQEYGKGKIVFFASVTTFSNSFIYRSNAWKLGLNSVNWLSNNPIQSNYKSAGLFSFNLVDMEYKFLEIILFSLFVIIGITYLIRKDLKSSKSMKEIKIIKNWKYNILLAINSIFLILGALLFIPINLILLDKTNPDYYDPYFAYILLVTGIIFLFFSGLNIYSIFHRQRIEAKYSYIIIALILIFVGITIFIGDIFPFEMIQLFTLGALILLVSSLINLGTKRNYGMDLIIEGKEFNRLSKLSSKSLPLELKALYAESAFIGEGGFGRVFKAKRNDGKEVAIKIPKNFDKKSEKIFITEVSNWINLDHPNIVKLFDFKILPIPYIEMEYCEGALKHGLKPLNEAIKVIYETAQGLNYAHHKKIIHGDIKVSNIMILNNVYKISDWGLSKLKTQDSITLSGATPQYAAPEQISREFGRADERTDIYQLGMVFYELVTGNLPFKGEISEVYSSILTNDPILPSKITPEANKIEYIIMRCLNKNKKDRYSSMEELIKDLEEHYTPSTIDETILFKNKKVDNI